MAELNFEVQVIVRDANGLPISGYPAADIWLADTGVSGDNIALCQGGSGANADTDVNGATTLSGVIAGGGHSQVGMAVYVSGVAVTLNADGSGGIALPIDVNSPDISGDLLVNLADISLFSAAIVSNDFVGDYTYDGFVNLSDISLFSQWIGESCP